MTSVQRIRGKQNCSRAGELRSGKLPVLISAAGSTWSGSLWKVSPEVTVNFKSPGAGDSPELSWKPPYVLMCLPGNLSGKLWLPNFVQGPLRRDPKPQPQRGRRLRNVFPGSPPPCDAEESVAGGGADAELSADNQGHCLYPF